MASGISAVGEHAKQAIYNWENPDDYITTDTNDEGFTGKRIARVERQQATKDLDPMTAFFVNGLISVCENLLTLPTGPVGTGILMGTSVAGDAASSAAENGLDPLKALQCSTAYGVVTGVVEHMGAEKMIESFGRLRPLCDGTTHSLTMATLKTVLPNIATAAGSEAIEEFVEEIVDVGLDLMYLGSKSEMRQYLDEYAKNNPKGSL